VIKQFTARCVLDTSSWEGTRDLEHMPAFLESLVHDDLGRVPKDCGSPHTLVLSGAGLRGADVTRFGMSTMIMGCG
jgi:protein CMS1